MDSKSSGVFGQPENWRRGKSRLDERSEFGEEMWRLIVVTG